MNRIFVAFDGDNAGQHIGQAVLMDDVQKLHDISASIDAGSELVRSWVQSKGGQMISSGGDEGTFVIDPSFEPELEDLRAKYQEITGFSATVGVGFSLSQAGKSLIAGKLSGKDQILKYDESVEDILREAHEASMAGTADEEQQKMSDHYLDATMGEDQGHEYYEEDPSAESSDEEDLMMLPEDQEVSDMDFDQDQEEIIGESADIPMHPDGVEEMPAEESLAQDQEMMPEEESDFESEEPIELDTSNSVTDTGEDEDSKKADEMISEAADEELSGEDTEQGSDMIEDPEMLEADLADDEGREEILQRIAANLDAFKQNRELMEQIKQAKPDLYQSILGLLQNMIDLAKILDPSFVSEEQPQEMSPEEMSSEEVPMEEESLPKQSG
jgi:hypothetical protein